MMQHRRARATATFLMSATAFMSASTAWGVEYRIERIASGLDQPTYLTQAPGDPSNIIYFSERTTNPTGGFDTINAMGRIWRYDINTRTKTMVLDLSHRQVTQDAGLQAFAFHPDFNVPGSDGFGKMYVSSSQRASPTISRVEEYTIGGGGTATLTKNILTYTNSNGTANNHTVNWIGFDPTATGAAKNYLYVSTGDGAAFQAFRPSQDLGFVRGKMLRLDISPDVPDAYPGNTDRNYNFPSSNPLPAYNAANPGSPINGLGEIYMTGLRNAYRASFDRATGDMYIGDVGEGGTNAREEIHFVKAGSNPDGPPVDLGWPQRQGTLNGITAPFSMTNPNTGVTSLNPIQEWAHSSGGNAAIGGYVHRGPIAELEGKYIYGDFVKGWVFQLEFDRDTPAGSYNGNNGTLTDVTNLWNSRLFDPTDPNYTPQIGDLFGIDHISAFGEDNEGNLYIIDFGHGNFFQGQYPAAGFGEIFKVTIGHISGSWNVNSSGTWSNLNNWAGGVPDSVNDHATFGAVIGAPRTITVDGPKVLGGMTFANTNSYTLGGAGTINFNVLSGSASINVSAGTHTVSAPVVLNDNLIITSNAGAGIRFTGELTAAGQTITKAGEGTAQFQNVRAAALVVDEGSVGISAKDTPNSADGTSVVGSLSIATGASLDLRNNDLIIDYADTSPIAQIRTMLADNRLTTTSATPHKRLGYAENTSGHTTFSGQSVDDTSILIKFTYQGDADLDGDVDGIDVGLWAQNFTGELGGAGNSVWSEGDWDYDGDVDGIDVGLWAQAFTGELGGAAMAGVVVILNDLTSEPALILQALGVNVVPEPAFLVFAAPAWLLLRRRR